MTFDNNIIIWSTESLEVRVRLKNVFESGIYKLRISPFYNYLAVLAKPNYLENQVVILEIEKMIKFYEKKAIDNMDLIRFKCKRKC